MNLSDFDYELPEKLIAQKPTLPRDKCRLLILDRKTGKIQHKKFFDIVNFLQKGDVLVVNDSKVIPARLYGKKITGGNVEIFLIKKKATDQWEALLKNFKASTFSKASIDNKALDIIISKNLIATPIENVGEGIWKIKFNQKGSALDASIRKYGQTPLPPYIKKQSKLRDYQTIYAQKEGSVAAPTAGLHFTKKLFNDLKKKGVVIETVTLHVGLGTFSPIREDNIEKHKMHSEWAEVSAKTAKAINRAKADGRRVIAVGTTSVRTLEAFACSTHNLQPTTDNKNQKFKIINPIHKEVSIFIKPGYKFKIVDGMITNFHLPKTTLLILVSAFAGKSDDGRKKILKAYQEAVIKKYKFFSFGDAMLIV